MIRRRVGNIIKRFARNGDDVLIANFQRVRGFDVEWKLLRRPAKHNLSNFTPLWANRNFGADRSNVVSVGIGKRDVNIAVCFHFCINDTSCKSRTTFPQMAFLPLSCPSSPHSAQALPMRKSATVSLIE
jgi:hypothetical protein